MRNDGCAERRKDQPAGLDKLLFFNILAVSLVESRFCGQKRVHPQRKHLKNQYFVLVRVRAKMLTSENTVAKSFDSNILPVKSMKSRFCEQASTMEDAKFHGINILRV